MSPSADAVGVTGSRGRPAGSGGPAGTRERLIATAERLFAARGVDGVSLREISRESGARNAVATQYHFADRAGVIAAIVAKHEPPIDAARHALLDALAASGGSGGSVETTIRLLGGALVRPLAAKLADPDGGPEFLQINAELLDRSVGPPTRPPSPVPPPSSLTRWREAADPILAPDAVRLHRRYTAILHTATELGRRARTGPHTDDRLFTSHLIDVVTAILAAPVSGETLGLVDERDRAVRGRAGRRPRPA